MTEEVNCDLFPHEPIGTELFPALKERAIEREIHDLLTSIADKGVSLRWEAATGKLIASPGHRLTEGQKSHIKAHKARIIAAMREWKRREEDRRYRETGIIQSERQVLEMAKEKLGEVG